MNLKNLLLSAVILCGVSFKTCAVGELENIGLGVVAGVAFKHFAQTESPLQAAGNIIGLGAAAGGFSGVLTMNAMNRNEKPASAGSGGPTAVGMGNFFSQLWTNGGLMFITSLTTAAATYGIEKYIKMKKEARLEQAGQKSTKK